MMNRGSISDKLEQECLREIIAYIHSTPCKLVLAITGGGSGAIEHLLKYGGGSSTLIEAVVPYSSNSLDSFIGRKPLKYASSVTARAMAMGAYRRALSLKDEPDGTDHNDLFGVGVSCKLSTGKLEREGREHKIFVSLQFFDRTLDKVLTLTQERSREDEELIASCMVLDSIAKECGWDGAFLLENILYSNEIIEEMIAITSNEVGELLAMPDNIMKDIDAVSNVVRYDLNKECIETGDNVEKPDIIFSGSFDPCHKNHILMAEKAFERYGKKVHFEISLTNVDKPPIDLISLQERLNSIQKYHDLPFIGSVFLTVAPLFVQKASLFENATFLIGADTANRLFKVRYYRNEDDMNNMLAHFRNKKTHFLIFQRKGIDLDLEPEILDICEVISLDEYLDNGTSSTSIRSKQLQN